MDYSQVRKAEYEMREKIVVAIRAGIDAAAILNHTDPDANIIFGASVDESFGPEVSITVIATGFPVTNQDRQEEDVPSPKVIYQSFPDTQKDGDRR